MREIVIYGASGHGKVVLENILNGPDFKVVGFIDDSYEPKTFCNLPVHRPSGLVNLPAAGIISIGDNYIRESVTKKLLLDYPNFEFINAIHSSVIIPDEINLGVGIAIMAGAIIQPGCNIGDHSIINTASSIDHDCIIGPYASISPNACLGGTVTIGKSSVIGLGANVNNNISIGDNCVLGSGGCLVNDLPSNKTATGVPAKVLGERSIGQRYL